MPIVENPAKTIFSPFLTISDHFPGGPESGFARRFKGRAIFGGAQAPLKMVKMASSLDDTTARGAPVIFPLFYSIASRCWG
jgi:hypothetical protein